MIKMNRTTEYGLMALRHMSRKRLNDPKEVTSAREIAERFGLPFEITAKTLQRLKDSGLIHSAHGAKGGYTLARSLETVSFAEFLAAMQGSQCLVSCAPLEETFGNDCECEYFQLCEIKGLMSNLNHRIQKFLESICLAELAESPGERIQLSSMSASLASIAPLAMVAAESSTHGVVK